MKYRAIRMRQDYWTKKWRFMLEISGDWSEDYDTFLEAKQAAAAAGYDWSKHED